MSLYNLTLSAHSSATSASTTSYIEITVSDTTVPVITYNNETVNNSNTEFGIDQEMSWSFSESVSYTLYINGTSLETGSGTGYSYTLDTTGLANSYWYNLTVTVTDGGSNQASQSLFIHNIDTVAPAITIGYSSKSIPYSATAQASITWTVYDLHNYNYSLYIDGVSVENGTLSSVTELVTIDVIMEIDAKLYKLTVYDSAGNYASDTVEYSVTTPQNPQGGQDQLPGSSEQVQWYEHPVNQLLLLVTGTVALLAAAAVLVYYVYKKYVRK